MKVNLTKLYGELRKAQDKAKEFRSKLQEARNAGGNIPEEVENGLYAALEECEEIRSKILEEQEKREMDAILAGNVNEKAHEDTEGRKTSEYRKALTEYLRNGQHCERETFKALNEYRAMNTTNNEKGGYLVDTETLSKVVESKYTFGAIYAISNKLKTQSGNPIQWAVSKEGITRGVIVGEAENHGKSDTTFGNEVLGAHKISSQIILVSDELLMDAYIDIAAYITRIARRRVTLGIDYYIINGQGGNAQPSGLLIQIPAEMRVEVTLPADPKSKEYYIAVYDGLVDVVHKVDAAYRVGSTYHIAINDKTLATIRKWKDDNGNPIYVRDPRADWPETLFGWPLVIDNQLPDLGHNGAVIAGDFQFLIVREAGDMVVKRLDELYAETGQVGFLAWQRFGVVLEDLAAMAMMTFAGNSENTPEEDELP